MTAVKMSADTFAKSVLLFLTCCGLVHQMHAETEHPFLSDDQGIVGGWFLCYFQLILYLLRFHGC